MIKIFLNKIWTILKKSFTQYYHNFVNIILVNVIWFSLIFLIAFAGYYGLSISRYFSLLIPVLFLGPVVLTGLYVLDEYLNKRQLSFKKIWKFVKSNSKRGFIAFLSVIFIYTGVIFNFYYFFHKVLGSNISVIDYGIMASGLFFLYILILLIMMELYFWGLLVLEKENDLLKLAKMSLILTLDNVLFSFGWLVLIIVLTFLIVISGFFIPLLFPVLMGLMILNGTKLMLKNYEELIKDIEEENKQRKDS